MGDVCRWHERHHDGCGDHSFFFLLFGDPREKVDRSIKFRMSTFGWNKTLGAPAHKWNYYVTFNMSSGKLLDLSTFLGRSFRLIHGNEAPWTSSLLKQRVRMWQSPYQ